VSSEENESAKLSSSDDEQVKPRSENNTPKSFSPRKLEYKIQKENKEKNIYNSSPLKERLLKSTKDFVSIQRHEDIMDHMKMEQKMIMKVNKEMHKKLQEASK